MEIYIQGFQDLLKDLCTQHIDIMHNDQTNVAFVRYQSHDDMGQVQNNASPVIVIVTRYYGRAAGQNADDMKMKQFVQIRFAVAGIPDAVINYSDIITAAADKAFRIMLDFLVKFRQLQHDDNCGPLRGLELESAAWSEIPEQPFLVEHYGWDLTIPFNSEFPDYDATRWLVS